MWAITAMGDTTGRLPRVRTADGPRDIYDNVMASQAPAQRRLVEGTLTGLRFVRNRIGNEADLGEFIEAGGAGPGGRQRRITSWTWKPLPDPALGSLPPRGQAWEITRYRAYQAHLAGHPIGETFGRAAEFLKLAAAHASPITDANVHAG